MLGEKLTALRKKCGYSQQELADKLSVTRQTISNWECGQGAPSLDKAAELAAIYNIGLDDLARDHVELVVREKKKTGLRLLKNLEGKSVRLSCSDGELHMESGLDWSYSSKVKILEVSPDWLRIEYTRTRENSLFKKETVIKLVDMQAVNGFEIEVEA